MSGGRCVAGAFGVKSAANPEIRQAARSLVPMLPSFFIDKQSRERLASAGPLVDRARTLLEEVAADAAFQSNAYNSMYLRSLQLEEEAAARGDDVAFVISRLARAFLVGSLGLDTNEVLDKGEEEAARQLVDARITSAYAAAKKGGDFLRRVGVTYYPRIHSLFADIESSATRFVFGETYSETTAFDEKTLFVTMGSCFAENIGKVLHALGLQVLNFASPEEASPLTFPELTSNIRNDPRLAEARVRIEGAPSLCFVFTAGVGEVVRLRSGEVVASPELMRAPARMRSIEAVDVVEPAAVAASLKAGLAELSVLNPGIRMVCTVSPVPLDVSFGRGLGVIPNNAYSKAVLMTGVRAFCSAAKGVSYFPSYELVKDWAPLAGIQPFGSDDGHPRHVNQNLVLVICLLFTKYFLGSGFYRQALRRLVGSEDLAAAMLADVRF